MKKLILILLPIVWLGYSCENENVVPDAGFVYFQVTDIHEPNGDSYVLALKNPTDIAQARAMIADTSLRQIILAAITTSKKENYYPNIDLNRGNRWSWHVAEFLGFADFTIEIYDGWPQYVEDNYREWVRITGDERGRGRIGFWSYTITREVAKSELGIN